MQNPSSSSTEPVGVRTRSKRKKISQNPKDVDDSDKNQPKVGKFSIPDDNSKTKQKDTKDPDEDEEVCPVCFDKPLHPLTLQCGHIYCFLCAKGLAESNLMSGGSCCLCRKWDSSHYFFIPRNNSTSNIFFKFSGELTKIYLNTRNYKKLEMMKKKLEGELLVVMEHAGSMKAEMAGGNLVNCLFF